MREENIHNYLASFADLTQQVDSENIAWVDVPQERTYPRIKYVVLSKPVFHQTDDQWQRWRFYIVGNDKYDVDLIARILKQKLNRVYGDVGGAEFDLIVMLDESEMILRDDNIYEVYQDYRVLYH